ncbi:MAG: outer membrane beta-barrel protein [Thermoanaerobaculia bacterium]|nr:outer membrane beta-barrel protein [Thermoanaerobaculia bacterium]
MPKQESMTLLLRLTVTSVLVATLLAAPTAADGSRWSVNLKVGESTIDGEITPDPGDLAVYIPSWAFDGNSTSVGLAVGYELHRYLQIEAGYHDLGTHEGQSDRCPVCSSSLLPTHRREFSFTGFSLVLLPKWPVTERLVLYAKVGAFNWSSDVTDHFSPGSLADPSETDLMTGVGARIGTERGVGVRFEYEKSALHDDLSLGASWQF